MPLADAFTQRSPIVEIEDLVRGPWPPTADAVRELLDEACVDAYGEHEQVGGMHCVIQDWGHLPCSVVVGGAPGTLIEVELREAALVGRVRLAGGPTLPIPLEDVVPSGGTPAAFMVAMYRLWRGLRPVVVEPEPSESSARTGS